MPTKRFLRNGKGHPPLIGVSDPILQINELITQLAHTRMNVLITGETGVGKEVVAQNLFSRASNLSGKFVKVNCAALPETLLESELFGFEKGAFTGADQKHPGKFVTADNGVLFLDEIGDMSLGLQSKILHVLQDGRFSPLGSDSEIKTDAWILSATHHVLEEDISRKEFREDLFYRLNTIHIHIPPLRQRKEDILSLIEYYARLYHVTDSTPTNDFRDNAAMKKLVNYPWPGNVRQLQNCIKKQMIYDSWEPVFDELSDSRPSHPSPQQPGNGADRFRHFLDQKMQQISRHWVSDFKTPVSQPVPASASLSLKEIKRETGDQVEKEIITYILKKTSWNKMRASKILKVSYGTLLYKIRKLNIYSC